MILQFPKGLKITGGFELWGFEESICLNNCFAWKKLVFKLTCGYRNLWFLKSVSMILSTHRISSKLKYLRMLRSSSRFMITRKIVFKPSQVWKFATVLKYLSILSLLSLCCCFHFENRFLCWHISIQKLQMYNSICRYNFVLSSFFTCL